MLLLYMQDHQLKFFIRGLPGIPYQKEVLCWFVCPRMYQRGASGIIAIVVMGT